MLHHEKIVIVTKKTALEDLIERFNTREQARFYIEHMGASFVDYEAAHDAYYRARRWLKESMPEGVRTQFIDRAFLPAFSFGDGDLIVTLGPDGLVVNTAKYLAAQPLLAFNPDRERIDGILLPFSVNEARAVLLAAVNDRVAKRKVSMARADLNDGQSLHAVNDFFVGAKTHVSARYLLRFGPHSEPQSSSGLIVSTGVGSTGWLHSILTGAARITQGMAPPDTARELLHAPESYRMDWESDELIFSVREPFPSRTSATNLAFGRIQHGQSLEITSQMPQNGVIFSDGVEEDFLDFNAGAVARIVLAAKKLNLIVHTA